MPEDNGRGAGTPAGDVTIAGGGKRQYIVAPRRGLQAQAVGVQPMSAGQMNGVVAQMGLDVVRRIKQPRRALETLSAGPSEATDVLVANIEPERAEFIARTAPQLAVGENSPLQYGSPIGLLRQAPGFGRLLPIAPLKPKSIRFRVLGVGDKPLANAGVVLTGDTVPAQGQTDKKGELTLDLYTLQDRPARSLLVTPPNNHWDFYLTEPELTDSGVNVVRLRAFSETIDGFPQGFRYGWGQRLMGLDRLPGGLNGQGVKIAIIDSGADNTHPLLSHVGIGRDYSGTGNLNSWNKDLIGHGSHCAGIIAARSDDQLRGFAPEAEIHVLKVFPGGRYDSLIDALNYCIDQQIDVVNMSLGGAHEVNPTVEQTLEMAVLNGIICVVAAGNAGDDVRYPASSSYTLAVAALGDLKEVQPDTWDTTSVQPQSMSADGIFSPSFTCHGPQISVCAPGVAIISTVPGGAFEAQSGTSMAAPHVTGLAAILLAHHPVFKTQLRDKNHARVAGLFSMIRSLCAPYPFGTDRTGVGLPRLHGLEQILQPPVEAAGAAAAAEGRQMVPGVMPQGAIIGGVVGPGGFVPLQVGPQQFAPQAALGGYPSGPMTPDPRLLAALYAQYAADPTRVNWLLGQGFWGR